MFISSSHMLKRVQFFESNWKEWFHSVSHSFSKKKGLILESYFWKVKCLESFLRKKTLWITLKKFHFFESVEKVFNLLSRIQQKRVQFFESYQKKEFNSFSYSKKSSILWVKFKKKRFNSVSHIQKKSSILWVKFKKLILWVILWKKFISWSQIWKWVQFFSSYLNKRSNSLCHIWTNGPTLCVMSKKFNCSIHCVILKKRVQFFGHLQRKRVQFCESYWKKTILRVKLKNSSILWIITLFFNGSILWVI